MTSSPTVKTLALATLVLFLAGCATHTGTVVPDDTWEKRRATLTKLDEFKADGKIALRTNERSDSASMIWVQSGVSSYVNLSGPLGTGATNLRSDGKTVTITRNGEAQTYDAESYENLDGFGIPVGTVGYWARGIPDPALPIDDMSVTNNLLRMLVQSGWTITYTDYDHFGSYTLPARLQLSKGSSKVTIFLYDWSLPVVQCACHSRYPPPPNSTCSCTSPASGQMAITICRRFFNYWIGATPLDLQRMNLAPSPSWDLTWV